ncbi:MAG: hypothetical protein EKK33_08950 [Bradyrhizobiaceae bacterium]|nr:MAG: hypothetical protein EKK33_08950 [Bradyrhizobiaceae bacterium]
MNEQIALGTKGDPELIDDYSAKAQKAAESLAPYRHARISPTDEVGTEVRPKVIRVGPIQQFKPGEEAQWLAVYGDKNEVERAISEAEASDKADAIIQRAKGGVPVEVPDLPREKLN